MVPQGPLDERPVSEADIQAYTDGSLPGERAARVRRYLALRPGEWHRILFYRRLNAQMRRAFGAVAPAAGAPVFAPMPPRLMRGSRALRRGFTALVAAFALAAAALAWLAVSEPGVQALNNAAVMALLEAGSGSHPIPNTSDALADTLAPGTRAAGPAPFDLDAAGLRFVASGTIELGPFARAKRWTYVNAEGQPVVLLASRAWFERDAPQWSARRVGDLRLIGWIGHGTRWVLAGNARTHGLMRAADAATRQMETRNEARNESQHELQQAARGDAQPRR
ncbi:anti-sigma factor RsiW [Paraburkholderia eburnea]|uniref:Anti-sigma factor RsiW n=1 Tax=Paraburkholderia eburnea TaxID=1189126 RepID=A0A2S4LT27_9BURK|nr:transcriptional regulator [Paraburkholderia eburnea]POR45607.1 anti-sigma factor RsiW [Paraburkholderia eburnea]PRZ14111.1 anti-sigma factor RsiW [Paraburkholderia eburnea]